MHAADLIGDLLKAPSSLLPLLGSDWTASRTLAHFRSLPLRPSRRGSVLRVRLPITTLD
jgi:hypothetical protein